MRRISIIAEETPAPDRGVICLDGIRRGSPAELGWVRKPALDEHASRQGHEVWKTPEGVLIVLPAGCPTVGVRDFKHARGVTVVVIEPEGVQSLWPRFSRAKPQQASEGE